MRKSHVLVAATMIAIASGSLAAQGAGKGAHEGFYGSVGAALGVQTSTIVDPGLGSLSHEDNTASYYAALGFRINPHWRVGAEWDYSSKQIATDFKATVMFYSAALTLYPSATDNMWFKLNLGYLQGETSGTGNNGTENGFAGGVGAGYDWKLGEGKMVLIPFINYFTQFSSSSFSKDLAGEEGKASVFQLGVGIGYGH
jgi:hypothetical protein